MDSQKPPISQAAIAEKLGVDQTTVSKWLSGERNIKLAEAIELEKITGGKVTAESWLQKKRRRGRGKAA